MTDTSQEHCDKELAKDEKANRSSWKFRSLKKTTRLQKIFWSFTFIFCAACQAAHTQDFQFLPEMDAYFKVNPLFRVYVQAKDDREGGDPTQFSVGPSVQMYFKPLLKLRSITSLDLDDSKSRALVLESGYRYITARPIPRPKIEW